MLNPPPQMRSLLPHTVLLLLLLFPSLTSSLPLTSPPHPAHAPRSLAGFLPALPRQQAPNQCSPINPCGVFDCCPNACCPRGLSFCPPQGAYCVNANGETTCTDKVDNATYLGTPCDAIPSRCCGRRPAYAQCARAFGEVYCINEAGFIACGDSAELGVLCTPSKCCPNPSRCCEVDGEVACCEFGEGGPLEALEDDGDAELTPAVPGATVDVEFPAESVAETPMGGEGAGTGTTEEEEVGEGGVMASASPGMGVEETGSEEMTVGPTVKPAESVNTGTELEPSATPDVGASASESVESTPGETEQSETEAASSVEMELGASGEAEASASVEAGAGAGGEGGDGSEEDESVCIPGTGVVEVRGAGRKLMREVRIGDRVRVSDGSFSEVVMWTHHEAGYRGRRFVRVELEGGVDVTVSEGHVVWRWRCVECEKEGVEAEDVGIGEWMWVVGEGLRKVVAVQKGVWGEGLFNAQTAAGDIVVDGVAVSCYTKWVEMRTAHGLLAPVRAAVAAWTLISAR